MITKKNIEGICEFLDIIFSPQNHTVLEQYPANLSKYARVFPIIFFSINTCKERLSSMQVLVKFKDDTVVDPRGSELFSW